MARINGLALKDHIRESLIFNRRLLTALFVTVLLLLLLVAACCICRLFTRNTIPPYLKTTGSTFCPSRPREA